jgi:hypothetical protein
VNHSAKRKIQQTKTNMKTEDQIELTPREAGRRNLTARTAVASLALAAATIPVVAGDGSKLVAEEASDGLLRDSDARSIERQGKTRTEFSAALVGVDR